MLWITWTVDSLNVQPFSVLACVEECVPCKLVSNDAGTPQASGVAVNSEIH